LGNITNLKCKECGRTFDPGAVSVCEYCFGPLEVDYNYERIAKLVTKKKIRKGPASIWRYAEFLPLDSNGYVDLSPGFTPLLKAERLGAELGIKNLYIKNDAVNPTFSVKDRMVAVAASRALELGFNVFACASTGNLANSVAAHAACAGIKSYILIPHDAEQITMTATNICAPVMIAVRGTTAKINSLCNEIIAREPWAFLNINLRAFYTEGAKTIAYEIAEQLDWQAPNHVVMPVASGSMLTKTHKGFGELVLTKLLRSGRVKMHGVQAEGCAPVVNAFKKGSDLVQPVSPSTIAKSLSIGNPADGIYALRTIRESGGTASAVSDNEMVEGMKILARTEGVFAEPAGGAVIMALKKMARDRVFKTSDTVVGVVTGSGMKTPEVMQNKMSSPRVIEPRLNELESFFVRLRREEYVPGAPGLLD